MRIVSPLIKYLFDTNKARNVGCIEGEYSKTIGLPVQSTQPFFEQYFKPDPALTNSVITSIELLSGTNLTNFTVDGTDYTLSSADTYKSTILVLSDINREIIAEIPLRTVIRNINKGKATFTNFDKIVWDNCYLYYTDPSGVGISTSDITVLRVYYTPKVLK